MAKDTHDDTWKTLAVAAAAVSERLEQQTQLNEKRAEQEAGERAKQKTSDVGQGQREYVERRISELQAFERRANGGK